MRCIRSALVLLSLISAAVVSAAPACSLLPPVTVTVTPSTDPASTSSKSSSSARPTSTNSASAPPAVPGNATSHNAALFPIPAPSGESWSTSSLISNALPLEDATFRPTKDIKALPHPYVKAPDDVTSMQAHYPAGSYNPSGSPRGGFSFYAPGPENVDLSTAKEATFSYSVFFPEGFEFVKGGKLPGLYGGDNDEVAVSCSGGRKDDNCFSVRLMWRTDGAGELYVYLPTGSEDSNKAALCDTPPKSLCNDDYGWSIGRGAFTFDAGKRTTVSQRVRMNDPGQKNGEMELFVEGKSVITVSGIALGDNESSRVRGMQMQTFFGGSDSTWATPSDQDVFFSDFSVAITETF